MKRAGKTFNCPWLFIYPLVKKRTVPQGENSCKRNCFIDGKQSLGNFDTPDLHDWKNQTCTTKLLLKGL